jgi:hypothetical protein
VHINQKKCAQEEERGSWSLLYRAGLKRVEPSSASLLWMRATMLAAHPSMLEAISTPPETAACRSRDTCRNRLGDWRRPTQSRVTTPLASKTAATGAAVPEVATATAAMTLEVMPASYVGYFVGSDFHIPNIIAYFVQNRRIRETKKDMEKLRQRAWMTEEASGCECFSLYTAGVKEGAAGNSWCGISLPQPVR